MRVGINFPWVSCGHDFGPGPPAWGGPGAPRRYDETARELEALARIGLDVTRQWILAGGVNYPVGRNPRTVAALRPVGEGRRHALARIFGPRARRALSALHSTRYSELALLDGVAPPTLGDAFVSDFRAYLRACEATGVRVIPSLLSFEFFQPALPRDRGIVQRGRAPFVFGSDPAPDARRAHVDAFLDATLSPLLDASRDHPSAIEAWEIVNEPEWAVTTGPLQLDPEAYGMIPTLPLVPPDAMSALLDRGVARVVDAGFVATVGFGDPNARWLLSPVMARFAALARAGRYVHQRHHYPTLVGPHTLPHHDASPIVPCILGELPTAMGGFRPDNVRWRDAPLRATEGDERRYLRARLAIARAHGYPLTLLWSARSTDPRKRWEAAQRAQVAALLDEWAREGEAPPRP